jgi:hypothetical protein
MIQMVECSPSKYKALSSNPNTIKKTKTLVERKTECLGLEVSDLEYLH